MSNYRIKYSIITNNLKCQFVLHHCGRLVETIEMDISFAYFGARMQKILDSSWERISQDLTAFVLSVVGDVPVDSEAPVVTSSISRICRHNLRRCSWG
jgi:hypothetical protein